MIAIIDSAESDQIAHERRLRVLTVSESAFLNLLNSGGRHRFLNLPERTYFYRVSHDPMEGRFSILIGSEEFEQVPAELRPPEFFAVMQHIPETPPASSLDDQEMKARFGTGWITREEQAAHEMKQYGAILSPELKGGVA